MELWLDTIDFNLIIDASKTLDITGITTNPAILAKSPLNAVATINKLLEIQNGLLAVQITENNYQDMLKQALAISKISNRIIIKVPVTSMGLTVIKALNELKIATMATAIYEPSQVLLSALAGTNYAAPYLGKIKDNPLRVVQDMQHIVVMQKFNLKLIIAAIRNVEQIVRVSQLGVSAVTVPSSIYKDMLQNNTQTQESLMQFETIWQESGYNFQDVYT